MKFFKQSKGLHEAAEAAGDMHVSEAPVTIEGGWEPVAQPVARGALWVVPADGEVLLVDANEKSVRRLVKGSLGDKVHFDVEITDSLIVHHGGHMYAVKGSTVACIDPSTGDSSYLCRSTGKYRLGTPVVFGGLLYFFGGQNDSSKKPSANIRAFDLEAGQWVAKTGFASKLPFKDLNPLVLHTDDLLVVASRDSAQIVAYDTQLGVCTVPRLEAPPGTLHVTCSGDTALFVTCEGIVGKQLVAGGWSAFTPTLPPLIHTNEIQALVRTGPTLLIHLATTHELWASAPLAPLAACPAFSPFTPTKDKKCSVLGGSDDFEGPPPSRGIFSRFSPRTKGYRRQLYDDEPPLVAAAS